MRSRPYAVEWFVRQAGGRAIWQGHSLGHFGPLNVISDPTSCCCSGGASHLQNGSKTLRTQNCGHDRNEPFLFFFGIMQILDI